eukprot:TRINITY_DN1717_c0_g1_i2.p1 TRINITY_DN1717_c0_g1~~TRINITY_DN1717_c0_g1_i2.p1  ORF type:complete len:170 (-),score=14.98 TRINITY_DN1717_c0_g1_i2:496-1005(-)
MAKNEKKQLKIVAASDSFGCDLKEALIAHLKSKGIAVEDLGNDKYYVAGDRVGKVVSEAQKKAQDAEEVRGLVACGTGVGVSIFANKHPGVYSVTCSSVDDAINCRSINNSNVIAVGGMFTKPEEGVKILDAWLETPFNVPCPASGGKPWPPEQASFLDNSLKEIPNFP